jgi:AP2-associated kinase
MLQEQSASRPTIDEVLMRAHSLLGTPAPDSVAHYAKLAQSGKQMSELPTLTSSKGGVELGADAAARALASQQAKGRIVPAAPGGTSDLIDMAPSEEETRRAEEAEARRRAEGITPMRRGRPGKTPGATATNGSPAPSPAPKPTPAPAARVPMQLTGPRSPDPSIKVAPASAGGFSDTFSPPTGFADSFAPSNAGSPASVATTHTAPQSAGLRLPPGSANELRTTPLNHSPALPGFGSNAPSPRVSPLPSPVAPAARSAPSGSAVPAVKSKAQDDEASSRFPSVAELDARYASPPAAERKEERAPLPGISQRESVGAVASRFASGSSSSSASNAPSASRPTDFGASLTARWPPLAGSASPLATPSQARKRPSIEHRHSVSGTPGSRTVSSERKAPEGSTKAPTLPTRKPMPQDWLTAELDHSAQASGESKTQKLAAPAVVPEKAAYRSPARYAAERLPDVVTDAPAAPPKAVPVDDSDSSGDEGPEEVEYSPRRPVSMAVSPSYGNASRSGRTSPGRIKKPSWLVEASKPASSASLQAAVSPRLQDAPAVPLSEAEKAPSSAERAPSPAFDVTSPEPASARSPQPSSARSPQPSEARSPQPAAARVPAWDEDDEEMRAMPPPRLDGQYIHRAPSGTVGTLIDIGGSRQASYDEGYTQKIAEKPAAEAATPPAADAGISPFAPTVKRFADAATSPTISSTEKDERRAPVAPVPRKGTAESMVSRYENLTLSGSRADSSTAAKNIARSRSASPAKLTSRPASPAKPSKQDDEAEDFKSRFPSVEVKQPKEPHSAPARAASPAKTSSTEKASRPRDFSPPRRANTLAAPVPFGSKDGDEEESKPQARLAQPGRPAPGSLVRERQRSLVGASKPDVIVPIMPRATRPVSSRPAPQANASLKPWERDAAEREAASKGGVVRGRVTAASPRDDDSGGEGFSGVGQLVSQWQTNAANGARGWGKVGEPRRLPGNPAEAKLSSEAAARVNGEESTTLRRSSTMSQLNSGRQPGRDV